MDKLGNITLYNADCMDIMKDIPDKAFDLAIVDPPYGIKVTSMTLGNGKNKIYRGSTNWDNSAPNICYFNELFRISKNQIIWGANHFISRILKDSSCWIVWDKGTGANSFADAELAYTSFKSPVKLFFKSWVGNNAKEKSDIIRIHPTQKPVDLYKWLLTNYAKNGDKILDTHLGSGSICIACHDLGFEMTGIELDPDYYEAAKNRIKAHQMQQKIF